MVEAGGECVLRQVKRQWVQVKGPTVEHSAVAVFVASSGVENTEGDSDEVMW